MCFPLASSHSESQVTQADPEYMLLKYLFSLELFIIFKTPYSNPIGTCSNTTICKKNTPSYAITT